MTRKCDPRKTTKVENKTCGPNPGTPRREGTTTQECTIATSCVGVHQKFGPKLTNAKHDSAMRSAPFAAGHKLNFVAEERNF